MAATRPSMQTLDVNGLRMQLAVQGSGPLVLLCHGFPELWISWRAQLEALAAAGYRAVAPDMRGFGGTTAPDDASAYSQLHLVGDMVELVRALKETQAVIVGHDWGAPIAWSSALLRPDVFRAVAGLSVPYAPNGETRPTDAFRRMAGDEEFYIEYFQQPGRAEAELEQDVRRWLLGFYFSISGDAPMTFAGSGTVGTIPYGAQMQDRFSFPEVMPTWLTDEDLDVYAGEFERTGFTGGLNRYRNVDRDWEDLSVFRGRPIEVPALFVGGSKDGPTLWGRPAIERFGETLPKLHRSIILDGCGHWTQQERPAEVNEALLDFLAAL